LYYDKATNILEKAVSLVLMTRPRHRMEECSNDLANMGHQVLHIPCFEIEGINQKQIAGLENLQAPEVIVFNSQEAIEQAYPYVSNFWPDAALWVMGPQSLRCIQSLGAKASIAPAPHTSEALWTKLLDVYPRMQRALLCTGKNRRGYLEAQFAAAGVALTVAEVYQRRPLPQEDIAKRVKEHLQDMDLMVFFSADTLEYFVAALDASVFSVLCLLPLWAISQRVADLAESLGFVNVQVSPQASWKHLMQGLVLI
jgi:uroporphyrinogen-III synthase